MAGSLFLKCAVNLEKRMVLSVKRDKTNERRKGEKKKKGRLM